MNTTCVVQTHFCLLAPENICVLSYVQNMIESLKSIHWYHNSRGGYFICSYYYILSVASHDKSWSLFLLILCNLWCMSNARYTCIVTWGPICFLENYDITARNTGHYLRLSYVKKVRTYNKTGRAHSPEGTPWSDSLELPRGLICVPFPAFGSACWRRGAENGL